MFLHQVQGFSLVVLVIFGLTVGGAILMMMLVGTMSFGLAAAIAPFPVLHSLSRELSSLALQAAGAVHLGVDNLGVVRHVGRLLDGNLGSCPAEPLKDGGLILLIDKILAEYSPCYIVKRHADEGMVRDGRVRKLDRLGNNATDEAADFGRRRVCFTCY